LQPPTNLGIVPQRARSGTGRVNQNPMEFAIEFFHGFVIDRREFETFRILRAVAVKAQRTPVKPAIFE
jgi:hypothetical protein